MVLVKASLATCARPAGATDRRFGHATAAVVLLQRDGVLGEQGGCGGQPRAHLVVLAPVHVGTAGDAGAVEHVCGLDALDVGEDGLAVLQASGGKVELEALHARCVVSSLGRHHTDRPMARPDGNRIRCTFKITGV